MPGELCSQGMLACPAGGGAKQHDFAQGQSRTSSGRPSRRVDLFEDWVPAYSNMPKHDHRKHMPPRLDVQSANMINQLLNCFRNLENVGSAETRFRKAESNGGPPRTSSALNLPKRGETFWQLHMQGKAVELILGLGCQVLGLKAYGSHALRL